MQSHDVQPSILDQLEERLGYRFRDRALLTQALTHSSFAYESRDIRTGDNERLEYLGDSVLNLVVAEHLYREDGGRPEGELTRLRSLAVSRESLAEKARALEIGRLILFGRGCEKNGMRENARVLAGALEAVIGAVYLDGALAAAAACVRRIIA